MASASRLDSHPASVAYAGGQFNEEAAIRAVGDWWSPRKVIGPGLLPLGRPGDRIGADAQLLRLLPRVVRHYPACRVPASSARPAQDGGAGVGGPAVHDPEGAGVPDPQGACCGRG